MYKALGYCGRFGDHFCASLLTPLQECHFLGSCAPAQVACSFVSSLEKTEHSQNCNSSLHPNVPHQWKISKFTKPYTQHTHPIHVWGLQQHQWGTDLITLCPLFLLTHYANAQFASGSSWIYFAYTGWYNRIEVMSWPGSAFLLLSFLHFLGDILAACPLSASKLVATSWNRVVRVDYE